KTLKLDGKFSIRLYDPMVLVGADMKDADGNANKSFRKLFKYISKGNEKEQKIAMTTPVFMDKGEQEDKKMYFVMPDSHVKDGTPAPKDTSLKVIKQPEKLVAAYRYKGGNTEAKNDAGEQLLKDWLTENDFTPVGDSFTASYDSPFKPRFLHTNEVLFEIDKEALKIIAKQQEE
ncbi:heme-binding protein, partial [Akkermansiaceae bacterium]|nr:heme-binding protein [Akkermansiaceae bacterium]